MNDRVRGAIFAGLGAMLGVLVAYALGAGTDLFYPGSAVLAGTGAMAGVWVHRNT